MSEAAVKTDTLPLEAQIREMVMAQFASRLIHLAATLKLSDHLAGGPKTAEELAPLTATHAPSLYRVMRTLASLGLFTEDASHRFALRPLGAVLQSGTHSYAAALTLGGDIVTRSLDHLLYSVQTGRSGFTKSFGVTPYEWLASHPAEASLFNQTRAGFHGMEPPTVASAYDFSPFRTIADLGGATGNLLTTILAHYPAPRGILFDLPQVVRDAPALIAQRGLTDRVQIVGGSFFDRVPAGADAYILSHVIHDWNEEQCLTILGNCRRAMSPGARLLLVEMVLPEGDAPHRGKMLDMIMLSVPGGQERTEAEYGALLDKAGFRLMRVAPTTSHASIVEAAPVE